MEFGLCGKHEEQFNRVCADICVCVWETLGVWMELKVCVGLCACERVCMRVYVWGAGWSGGGGEARRPSFPWMMDSNSRGNKTKHSSYCHRNETGTERDLVTMWVGVLLRDARPSCHFYWKSKTPSIMRQLPLAFDWERRSMLASCLARDFPESLKSAHFDEFIFPAIVFASFRIPPRFTGKWRKHQMTGQSLYNYSARFSVELKSGYTPHSPLDARTRMNPLFWMLNIQSLKGQYHTFFIDFITFPEVHQ